MDSKLVGLYDIAKPRWARARRRPAGTAGIHCLRHGRLFVLIATHGKRLFFEDHATYRNLRAQMLDMAVRASHRAPDALEREFQGLRWQPYEPVRRQLAAIVKAVNRKRRHAGYRPISLSSVPAMRRIGSVFVEPCSTPSEAA